jgi:hypothetical protein
MQRMLREVFGLEGYVAQGTSSGEVARRLLQAAEGGMIVYLEPALLSVVGNEQLHDYVMNRDGHTPQVWVLLAGTMFREEDMGRLRADSSLEQPFTADQALASVEEAQRLLRVKRFSAGDPSS